VIHVRNILYGTDFSPYSNQAYFHAVALAEKYGAGLTIVYVYAPSTVVAPMGVALPAADGPEELDHWRRQLEQIRPLSPSIAVQHVLLIGDPATEILRYARESQTDLIVVGTHGRTGLERPLMGSVAEKVLRGAPCSVLVVKMPKAASITKEPATAEAPSPV
jgi:nucleotide-binding universal stress UspA family protein